MRRLGAVVAASLAAAGLCVSGTPADAPGRTVLGRAEFTAPDGMEVIASVTELKRGETLPRHYHHGIESGYVLQGSTVQFPGKAPMLLATGASVMTPRNVPHAGFTVVGPQSLKLYTVHIVDKGKPLFEWVAESRPEP